jgi:large subunit ribosomal protein L23
VSELYNVLKRPVITEKANLQQEKTNQYSFEVAKESNKIEVKKAIETRWNVHVEHVRIVNVASKPKRVGRNFGRKSGWKKAMVKLRDGESIEFFQGV